MLLRGIAIGGVTLGVAFAIFSACKPRGGADTALQSAEGKATAQEGGSTAVQVWQVACESENARFGPSFRLHKAQGFNEGSTSVVIEPSFAERLDVGSDKIVDCAMDPHSKLLSVNVHNPDVGTMDANPEIAEKVTAYMEKMRSSAGSGERESVGTAEDLISFDDGARPNTTFAPGTRVCKKFIGYTEYNSGQLNRQDCWNSAQNMGYAYGEIDGPEAGTGRPCYAYYACGTTNNRRSQPQEFVFLRLSEGYSDLHGECEREARSRGLVFTRVRVVDGYNIRYPYECQGYRR